MRSCKGKKEEADDGRTWWLSAHEAEYSKVLCILVPGAATIATKLSMLAWSSKLSADEPRPYHGRMIGVTVCGGGK